MTRTPRDAPGADRSGAWRPRATTPTAPTPAPTTGTPTTTTPARPTPAETTTTPATWTERVGLALASACVAATFTYAALRAFQAMVLPEPDPALVLWSAHSGFFWRCWTSAYAGGTVAFIAWLAAGRAPARVARVLVRALPVAAAALAAQGLLVP